MTEIVNFNLQSFPSREVRPNFAIHLLKYFGFFEDYLCIERNVVLSVMSACAVCSTPSMTSHIASALLSFVLLYSFLAACQCLLFSLPKAHAFVIGIAQILGKEHARVRRQSIVENTPNLVLKIESTVVEEEKESLVYQNIISNTCTPFL